MTHRSRMFSVVTITAVAMLTACTGSRDVPASAAPGGAMNIGRSVVAHGINRVPSWISPALRRQAMRGGLLFVADNFDNQIDVYDQRKLKRRIGTITKGVASPTGVAIDKDENLYVADYSTNSVVMYPPPYTGYPVKKYSGRFYEPVAVAVGMNGDVYISDYTDGLLAEYRPRKKQPYIIPLTGRPTGLALDANNNLFVGYASYTGFSGVLEFRSGSIDFTDSGIRVGFAGGITFDSNGNLILEDELAQSLNVYPPGSTKPLRVIMKGFLNPVSLAFDAAQKRLYIADGGALDVDVLPYPGFKTVTRIHGFDAPYGVALSPAAPK